MAILYNLISRLNAISVSIQGFPSDAMVKNLPANAEDSKDAGLILGLGKPWSRKWQPNPVFLPGKSQEQRSLAGYSPWGCKELDMTKWFSRSLFSNEFPLALATQRSWNPFVHPRPTPFFRSLLKSETMRAKNKCFYYKLLGRQI